MTFWTGFHKQAKLKEDVELKQHQVRAKKKLEKSHGLLIYHGLGSGKTLTSIAATQGKDTDVIVPAALRNNYKKEVTKYTKDFHPRILSYEKAVKTPPSDKATALVMDEAHNIGRIDSQRSRQLMEKAKGYKSRLLLTATPIRNRPSELGPLFAVARGDEKIPTDPKKFDDKFIREEQINPGIFARILHGAKPGIRQRMNNRKEFEALTKGYVDYFSAGKEGYPSASYETVSVPMGDEQKELYDFALGKAPASLRWKIRRGGDIPPSRLEQMQLNSFLNTSRQLSNVTTGFGGKDTTPKFKRAVGDLLKRQAKNPDMKAVVYSNFLDSGVRAYAKELGDKKIPYAIFSGGISDRERKEIVDDYNSGKIKVLLLSGAGAYGLDLKKTGLVQLMEPAWNNPKLEQVVGRAIRYGSHEGLPKNLQHVHVQHYQSTIPKTFFQKVFHRKADQSVDQYLDNLSEQKEALSNQFLDVLKRVGSKS